MPFLMYDPNAPQQSGLGGLNTGLNIAMPDLDAMAQQSRARQDAMYQQLMAQQAQDAPRGLDFGQLALLAEATNQYREARQQQQQQQTQPTSAPMFYNPGTGQFFRNGMVIDEDDDAGFVALAEAPSPEDGVYAKPGSDDWIGMLPGEVSERLQGIKNPSFGKLMGKNWDIGVSNMKMLTGALMSWAGMEEAGGKVMAAAHREVEKNQPYSKEFTGVLEGRDSLLDWFAASIAQQGPNLASTVLSAAAGAAAGSAVAPGAGTIAGGVTGFLGRGAASKAALRLAKQFATKENQKLLVKAAAKYRNGKALDAAEAEIFKKAAMGTAAAASATAANYGMALGDTYNEMIEHGTENRALAAATGIPYAMLDLLPQALAASKILGFGKAFSGGLPTRVGKGVVVGMGLEGLTEGSQKVLTLAAAQQNPFTPKNLTQIANEAAAGAAVGSLFGAASGVRSAGTTTQTDINDPSQPADLLNGNPEPETPVAANDATQPAQPANDSSVVTPEQQQQQNLLAALERLRQMREADVASVVSSIEQQEQQQQQQRQNLLAALDQLRQMREADVASVVSSIEQQEQRPPQSRLADILADARWRRGQAAQNAPAAPPARRTLADILAHGRATRAVAGMDIYNTMRGMPPAQGVGAHNQQSIYQFDPVGDVGFAATDMSDDQLRQLVANYIPEDVVRSFTQNDARAAAGQYAGNFPPAPSIADAWAAIERDQAMRKARQEQNLWATEENRTEGVQRLYSNPALRGTTPAPVVENNPALELALGNAEPAPQVAVAAPDATTADVAATLASQPADDAAQPIANDPALGRKTRALSVGQRLDVANSAVSRGHFAAARKLLGGIDVARISDANKEKHAKVTARLEEKENPASAPAPAPAEPAATAQKKANNLKRGQGKQAEQKAEQKAEPKQKPAEKAAKKTEQKSEQKAEQKPAAPAGKANLQSTGTRRRKATSGTSGVVDVNDEAGIEAALDAQETPDEKPKRQRAPRAPKAAAVARTGQKKAAEKGTTASGAAIGAIEKATVEPKGSVVPGKPAAEKAAPKRGKKPSMGVTAEEAAAVSAAAEKAADDAQVAVAAPDATTADVAATLASQPADDAQVARNIHPQYSEEQLAERQKLLRAENDQIREIMAAQREATAERLASERKAENALSDYRKTDKRYRTRDHSPVNRYLIGKASAFVNWLAKAPNHSSEYYSEAWGAVRDLLRDPDAEIAFADNNQRKVLEVAAKNARAALRDIGVVTQGGKLKKVLTNAQKETLGDTIVAKLTNAANTRLAALREDYGVDEVAALVKDKDILLHLGKELYGESIPESVRKEAWTGVDEKGKEFVPNATLELGEEQPGDAEKVKEGKLPGELGVTAAQRKASFEAARKAQRVRNTAGVDVSAQVKALIDEWDKVFARKARIKAIRALNDGKTPDYVSAILNEYADKRYVKKDAAETLVAYEMNPTGGEPTTTTAAENSSETAMSVAFEKAAKKQQAEGGSSAQNNPAGRYSRASTEVNTPAGRLADYIGKALVRGVLPDELEVGTAEFLSNALSGMYAAVPESARDTIVAGSRLRDYFRTVTDEDGNVLGHVPIVVKIDGYFHPLPMHLAGVRVKAALNELVAEFEATANERGGLTAWQKARDAKKTKLDYPQWVQVRTPRFKAWFGDWENTPVGKENGKVSVVRDKQTGEPLVVYHGSPFGGFSAFQSSSPVWMTPTRPVAAHYASAFNEAMPWEDYEHPGVYDLFADIKNPLVIEGNGATWKRLPVPDAVAEAMGGLREYAELVSEDGTAATDDIVHWALGSNTKAARTVDYDGVIFREIYDGGEIDNKPIISDVIVAQKNTQVKSAKFNAGTFDGINEDMMFARSAPTPKGVSVGNAKLIVNRFVNRLAKGLPLKVHVFRNQAELRQQNRNLYDRAAAARPDGDFDTVVAAGYAFGNDVLVFSDNVSSDKELRVVLAHEILGHFGLRGVLSEAELSKVLDTLKDHLPAATVEQLQERAEMYGTSLQEELEEYLADYAAELDTSLIKRIWAVVKNALNKLGLHFDDDMARYVLSQARRYVLEGDGRALSADGVANSVSQFAGRYARTLAPDATLGERAIYSGYADLGEASDWMHSVKHKANAVASAVSRALNHVQTTNNKALRSEGYATVLGIIEDVHTMGRALLSKYHRLMSKTYSPTLFGKGVSEAEKESGGELLTHAALLRMPAVTDEALAQSTPLLTVDDKGEFVVNDAELKRLKKAGYVTADEFRNGFDIKLPNGEKYRFQRNVDEKSNEWVVYNEARDAVNEAAIDALLAKAGGATSEVRRLLNDGLPGIARLNAQDRKTINLIAGIARAIARRAEFVKDGRVYTNGNTQKELDHYVTTIGRALFNDDVMEALQDPASAPQDLADEIEHILGEEGIKDVIAGLADMRTRLDNKTKEGTMTQAQRLGFSLQQALRDMQLLEQQVRNAELHAKQTILGAYVPFSRWGDEQVRLTAVDARTGKAIELPADIRATLPYFLVDGRAEALAMKESLDDIFDGTFDVDGTPVMLVAEVSRAKRSKDYSNGATLSDMMLMLNRLGINPHPNKRAQLVKALTAQGSAARHALRRKGTPGWDKNVVRSVSEYLEHIAHSAAKNAHGRRFDAALNNNSLWLGDDGKLARLRRDVATAATPEERAQAQRAYDSYAYKYLHMKAVGETNTVEIAGKNVPTKGMGEEYREEAKALVEWIRGTTNIAESTEDLLSGEIGSKLKLATVMMQLGGSVASAVVNLSSLVTHALPYLSYYNAKRGFGGGYGTGKAASALFQAGRDVAYFRLADAKFLEDLITNKQWSKYGLTEQEAMFLFEQTEQGALQAAQFNALIGSARGKVNSNNAQAAIKAWMAAFAYTEQFNRRTTALAAFRLEQERLRAAGLTDEVEIFDKASRAARDAVTDSQGEYAMWNRPAMARGNVLQYLFMYKQFVITTVQLLRNMPVQGQLAMLGMLFLCSGLKGMPFADDLMDIIDTICQKLGLKMPSVEKAAREFIDGIAPGMSPYVMRGVLDRFTGATMSTRLGQGDLIPLSGAFKAGADPWREAANFAGPVFAGISGLAGLGANVARYGAEAIGLRDDTTDLTSALRESPIAGVRAIADGMTYLTDGAITNSRGQVVSNDATVMTAITRMLGFYPSAATTQNDASRLMKGVSGYAREISNEYKNAYVKAAVAGDRKRMAEIKQAVREWNRAARGTGLELPQRWEQNAMRAAREAKLPLGQRTLKAQGKAQRNEAQRIIDLLDAD